MPLTDHGKKHMCFKCGTKFYDLYKDETICPSCGANQADKPDTPAPTRSAAFATARASLMATERSILAGAEADEADDTDAEDEEIIGDIGGGDEEEEEEEEEESSDDDDED